jgi:hypothetical protein
MNHKLLAATLGALILASSGCALIDDRRDPYPLPRAYSEGDRWARPIPHSHEYRDHDFHDRWQPRPSKLAPNWGSHDYDHSSGRVAAGGGLATPRITS